jgi:hypothetical protein
VFSRSNLSIKRRDCFVATLLAMTAVMLFSAVNSVFAKSKNDVRNELPSPFGLQAVVLNKTITLSWQWQSPEELPIFAEFGYEIKRQDGKHFQTSGMTYADVDLSSGTYSYEVRARGSVKEKGKPVIYVSDWAGPAGGAIKSSCPRPPAIELTAEPTAKRYGAVSSTRFHLQGKATVDAGCTMKSVRYHLDTGTGIVHSGPLKLDGKGNFDTFVNAFEPEDEIPAGRATFNITAIAEDEAGPNTSSAYAVEMELENPYAPHTP